MVCVKRSRWRVDAPRKEGMTFPSLLFAFLLCGVQSSRIKRIVGGHSTEIEMVPYMLSMRLNNKHICGAVIIDKEWSLTAAHCCIDYTDNTIHMLSMQSGSAWLYKGGKIHRVTKVKRNGKYMDDDDDYDICAIRVDPPFEYSSVTMPVRLPNPDGVALDTNWGLVSGWGYTKADGDTLSSKLQSINVTKVDLQHCKYMYRNLYTIHDSDVCYGSGSTSKDACQGDSGGPLVNDESILIGLVSFGDDCGFSILPGIYTDIVQFRNWIKNTTGV